MNIRIPKNILRRSLIFLGISFSARLLFGLGALAVCLFSAISCPVLLPLLLGGFVLDVVGQIVEVKLEVKEYRRNQRKGRDLQRHQSRSRSSRNNHWETQERAEYASVPAAPASVRTEVTSRKRGERAEEERRARESRCQYKGSEDRWDLSNPEDADLLQGLIDEV